MYSNMKYSLPIWESLDWIQILLRKKILIVLAELGVDLKDFKPQTRVNQREVQLCVLK